MSSKSKYAIPSLTVLALGIIVCVYIVFILGVFSKDKIVVKAIATTGPDYEVVFGQLKLGFQMPDSVTDKNVNGVMLTDKSSVEMNNYINRNSSGVYDDYYVLTENIVGAKRSDGTAFHPLIEITSTKHLAKIFIWSLVVINIALLLLFRFLYKKHKRAYKNNGT
jgi:Kef-type K+ transport system membrane component KefB